jgi:hypothetical protein
MGDAMASVDDGTELEQRGLRAVVSIVAEDALNGAVDRICSENHIWRQKAKPSLATTAEFTL